MYQPTSLKTHFVDAANYLVWLPHEASAVLVNGAYWSMRTELEYLIDHADDPSTYAPAWRLIGEYGQEDLRDYLGGDNAALERLKVKVAESITLLP